MGDDPIDTKKPFKRMNRQVESDFTFDADIDILTCVECGVNFELAAKAREFFVSKELLPPRRCVPCRKIARERNQRIKSQAAKATLADIFRPDGNAR